MTAQPSCGIAHLAIAAVCFAAPAAPQVVDAAMSQSTAKALRHALTDDSPVVRGEAALCLAVENQMADFEALRSAARSRHLAERTRGLLALAVANAPSSDSLFEQVLQNARYDAADAAVAAFALGYLPDDQPNAGIARFTTEVDGGSPKRVSARLASLFGGLATSPHPSRQQLANHVLEQYDGRAPRVEAMALLTLWQTSGLTDEQVSEYLEHDDPLMRRAAMVGFLNRERTASESCIQQIAKIAMRERDAQLRALAIRVLTAQRSTATLKVLAAAMKSRDEAVQAAGLQAGLALGGRGMRQELAERLAKEKRDRRAPLLRAWRGSIPDVLRDAALKWCSDDREDTSIRVAAATLLARSGDKRTVPVLRRLAPEVAKDADAMALFVALRQLDPKADLVELTKPKRPAEHQLLGARIRGLLAADAPGTFDFFEELLEDETINPRDKAGMLRAYRRSRQPAMPQLLIDGLPTAVADLLR